MTYAYLGILALALLILFNKHLMQNQFWRATMTPLASIIGSGFLIAAPILGKIGGENAPYLMIALCLLSFGVGKIIRWNIHDLQALDKNSALRMPLRVSESLSDWALALAYVLSITYYLFLFSSFALNSVAVTSQFAKSGLTTVVLVAIAAFGHRQGLKSIEKIEGISVNAKLAIIFTFLVALGWHAWRDGSPFSLPQPIVHSEHLIETLLGLLIMVQGFETSRYLSERYDAQTRIRSMRFAQILSSIIYIVFIFLMTPIMMKFPIVGQISEVSVIDFSAHVLTIGPMLLVVAAVASQLSAAVADMGGAGGLFAELTNRKLQSKNAYPLIAALGVALVWIFNIFEIIAYASKAFALYYFVQCLSSCFFARRNSRYLRLIFSGMMAVVCLAVIVLGVPFEGS